MRVVSYVYNSTALSPVVAKSLKILNQRDDGEKLIDVGAGNDPTAVRREALLTVKGAVRVGSLPSELFDQQGELNFSPGVLISSEPTGRRSLHIGEDALTALREDADGP